MVTQAQWAHTHTHTHTHTHARSRAAFSCSAQHGLLCSVLIFPVWLTPQKETHTLTRAGARARARTHTHTHTHTHPSPALGALGRLRPVKALPTVACTSSPAGQKQGMGCPPTHGSHPDEGGPEARAPAGQTAVAVGASGAETGTGGL